MPKKSAQINPFDGGLNNYSDARDIEKNELAEALNVQTNQPGKVSLAPTFENGSDINITDINPLQGQGYIIYNSDFNLSGVESNTELQVFANANKYYQGLVSLDTFPNARFTSGLSSITSPRFFVADGNLRISEATFQHHTKFLGYVKHQQLGAGSASPFLIEADTYIDEPYSGGVFLNDNDPPNESITDGTLNLHIKEKTGSTSEWVDTSDSNVEILTKTGSVNHGTQAVHTSTDGGVALPSGASGMTKFTADTDPNNSNYRISKSSGGTAIDITNKSVFVKIYVPSASFSFLQQEAFQIRLGNSINSASNSGNNAFVYSVDVSLITANQFNTIELKHGSHESVEGSPVSTNITSIGVDVKSTNPGTAVIFYASHAELGDSSVGLWNGQYKWYYSFVYDRTQESRTRLFANQTNPLSFEDKILEINVHAKKHSSGWLIGSSTYSERPTGANIYYAEFDLDGTPLDNDKKLFLKVDFENGVKKPTGETFEAWGSALGNGARSHTEVQITNPPLLDTFSTIAGYSEDSKLSKVIFGASTILNRRAYVGNVKVTDINGKTRIYSDRIYKSEPNGFDIFTEYGYIDVAINDGESITALENFQDFILQFKEQTMYLINVTKDIEYLEDTYAYRGVWSESAVCKTTKGIAWVNDYGCFLFDGKQVIDLLTNKIDRSEWTNLVGNKPLIGFKPLSQDLLVIGDYADSKAYNFNMITMSWQRISSNDGSAEDVLVEDDKHITNLQTKKDGTLRAYQDSTTHNIKSFNINTASATNYIDIRTKDETLEDPAQFKTLKKVYITYKINDGSSIPTVHYTTNNATGTLRNFTQSFSNTSNVFTTLALTPATASEANNKHSFQIVIKGMAHSSFVLNDINLVYREKPLK
tara:strand:+ start:17969 stop:20599 length:2631 start_codon:yes stop_codon:yes gene_type:complete